MIGLVCSISMTLKNQSLASEATIPAGTQIYALGTADTGRPYDEPEVARLCCRPDARVRSPLYSRIKIMLWRLLYQPEVRSGVGNGSFCHPLRLSRSCAAMLSTGLFDLRYLQEPRYRSGDYHTAAKSGVAAEIDQHRLVFTYTVTCQRSSL